MFDTTFYIPPPLLEPSSIRVAAEDGLEIGFVMVMVGEILQSLEQTCFCSGLSSK